jgi:hypothetical protein
MVFRWYIMVEKEEEEEKGEESPGVPTPARTIDKPTSSSSSITVDPTILDEKEESQLKEAIKKQC